MRTKHYKTVEDAFLNSINYNVSLNLDNLFQLQKLDKRNIGTHKYFGLSYFWHSGYKHYLRNATPKQRVYIHLQFIKNNVPLIKTKKEKYFDFCEIGEKIILSYKPLMDRLKKL